MVYKCFECNKEFGGNYSVECHYARLHDDKRDVCKCDMIYLSVCIKNGCSESESKIANEITDPRSGFTDDKIEDEITDKINDLVKDIVKGKAHKFDKSFDKSLDKSFDKTLDKDEDYT